MTHDVVIKNGTLIDGTGKPAFEADVAIAGGRIAEIGELQATGAEEIDASGLFVSPGFIDVNSHSAYTLMVDPRAVSALYQGVTMEVVGNCGHGCFPIKDPALAESSIYGFNGMVPIDGRSAAEYMDHLDESRPGINIVPLVPNAQLRISVVGHADRAATAAELVDMKSLLEECLDAGAWGLSVGLEYPAEVGASEEELTALCHVVNRHGGLFATHVRDRDQKAVEALEEVIRIAKNTGVRLQISHFLPRSGRQICEECLVRVDQAASNGLQIGFDMHTRTFGTTYLRAILPPNLIRLNSSLLARSLLDEAVRDQVRTHRSIISALGNWDKVIVFNHPSNPEYSRKSIAEIADSRNQSAIDTACDLIIQECDAGETLMVIMPSYEEDQLNDLFQHPLCVPGSNGTTMGIDGPLAGTVFHGTFTWASHYWNFVVNERASLTPEQAVRRLTGLPASFLNLTDRGVLATGAIADIAIFDPHEFRQKGTLYEPSQLAVGMKYVLVNGVLALREGRLTENRGGQVLRR